MYAPSTDFRPRIDYTACKDFAYLVMLNEIRRISTPLNVFLCTIVCSSMHGFRVLHYRLVAIQ